MRQQEVVGLYQSEQDAQNALDELITAGFPRERITINHESDQGQYTIDSSGRLVRAENYEPSIKHESAMQEFFRALVGKKDEKNRAKAYAHAVSHGHIVLQVATESDEQANRAMQIMDRHNPIDIDDYALSIRDFVAGMNDVPSHLQHGAAPSGEGSSPGKGESIYAGPPKEESGKQFYEGAAHTSEAEDFQRYCQEHWNRSYWTSGGSYDDYEPAYRYGADFADNDTDPHHKWADVEGQMHSDWVAYNRDENSWEKNKAAIQCGWEKGKMHGKGTHSGHSLQ